MIAGTIANRVRLLRFTNGEMSQEDLGRRVGVTRQTVAAIEAGKYSPSLETAFRIAHVFNVPLDDVFSWSALTTVVPA
jgi:putative transcriptional regulator